MRYSGIGFVISCFSSQNAALQADSKNVVKLLAIQIPVSCVTATGWGPGGVASGGEDEVSTGRCEVLTCSRVAAAKASGMPGLRPAVIAALCIASSRAFRAGEPGGLDVVSPFVLSGSTAYLTNSF